MMHKIVCRQKPYGFLRDVLIIGERCVAEWHFQNLARDTAHPEALIPWYILPVNAQVEFQEGSAAE